MRNTKSIVITTIATGLAASFPTFAAEGNPKHNPNAAGQRSTQAMPVGQAMTADAVIAQWPARPKLGAQMMLSQYGAPQEVSSEKLVWHDQGPYKRITVTKEEHHHDFPKPHMDFLEHTVSYQAPLDKVEALSTFDGSATYDRTRGELSGRCDLEGHNILTLNLANDILTGKKDADAARKAFSEIVVQDMMGKHPAYVTGLQFQPAKMTEFADKPTIPGSPVRPGAAGQTPSKDQSQGEVLGFLGAINENEIVAAMVAGKKKINSQVAEYAKMLHEAHGLNLDQTLKVGQKIKVVPLETAAVDALRMKGAGELTTIVPLDGEDFAKAYLAAMIKGHGEVLQLIDGQLLPKATSEELKKHLTETRQHVALHLQTAQRIQAGSGSGAPAAGVRGQQKQSNASQNVPSRDQ